MKVHKRLQVPVTKETYRAFQALSKAQSASLAAVTGEILEQCAPMVWEMANAIEMAKKTPSRGLKHMHAELEKLMVNADQVLMNLEPKPKARTKKAG